MKIFGINFETKKELRAEIARLEVQNDLLLTRNGKLADKVNDLSAAVDSSNDELHFMQQMFPFTLEQTVFDVALKNAQGKYTKKNPSFEHSTITEVAVNEKNYFSLVKRLKNNDVFYTKKAAEEYLKSVCK